MRLTSETQERLEEGIELEAFPKTFREAFDFSCRLGARYIWIDSICILQDSAEDWLDQSSIMDLVYNNSLCNLSATAAENSSIGLYFDRDENQVWSHTVNLKTDGLPGSRQDHTFPQECTVLDLNFWKRIIDDAPISKRGWVLQERLLSPCILHFCHDQIAWECWEKEYAECRPDTLPLHQIAGFEIMEGNGFKGMAPLVHGKLLRKARFGKNNIGELIKVDEHLVDAVPSIYCFELWRHIVEGYSKLSLTNPSDKFIALAGIAKFMSRRIFKGNDKSYVGGMWWTYLESQLLWRVDPVVEKGKFLDHSERPADYRAPELRMKYLDCRQLRMKLECHVRGIQWPGNTPSVLFEKLKAVIKSG